MERTVLQERGEVVMDWKIELDKDGNLCAAGDHADHPGGC